jgi:hypothetical protein
LATRPARTGALLVGLKRHIYHYILPPV